MESFAEAIKIIAEKHLIPTILSLVIAAIVFAYTPTDYWLLEKFTTVGYWLFIAGAIFIIIQFLIWIKKTISKIIHWINVCKSDAEYEQEQNQERLERFWSLLDSFSKEEINFLKQFLENDNNPIIIKVLSPRGRLFESPYIIKQSGRDEQGFFTKCILTENFYQDLKVSVKEYGKINHFEKV